MGHSSCLAQTIYDFLHKQKSVFFKHGRGLLLEQTQSLDVRGKHKLKLCWKIGLQDVSGQRGWKAHRHTHKTDTGEGCNDGTTAATAHLAKASSAAVDTTPLPALESKRN